MSGLEPKTLAFDNIRLWNNWANFKVFYMKTAKYFLPNPMVKAPTAPEYPLKSFVQKLFGTVGT